MHDGAEAGPERHAQGRQVDMQNEKSQDQAPENEMNADQHLDAAEQIDDFPGRGKGFQGHAGNHLGREEAEHDQQIQQFFQGVELARRGWLVGIPLAPKEAAKVEVQLVGYPLPELALLGEVQGNQGAGEHGVIAKPGKEREGNEQAHRTVGFGGEPEIG